VVLAVPEPLPPAPLELSLPDEVDDATAEEAPDPEDPTPEAPDPDVPLPSSSSARRKSSPDPHATASAMSTNQGEPRNMRLVTQRGLATFPVTNLL
jgi:hypothetical protein